MNDLEARFESLRDRARAINLDLTVLLGLPVPEGATVESRTSDGRIARGRKIGPDNESLAQSLATVDGFLTALELTRS